jgi:catechol 2,3-dioxygenase
MSLIDGPEPQPLLERLRVLTALYYEDPDRNIVELNVNNYNNEWAATEHMRNSPSFAWVNFDPEKMMAARKAGASSWELHERASAGEFAPAMPNDSRPHI